MKRSLAVIALLFLWTGYPGRGATISVTDQAVYAVLGNPCPGAFPGCGSRAFIEGSGWPILAATVISRASLLNSFDFWASCRPLRCMMFLNWEWPAMRLSLGFVRN